VNDTTQEHEIEKAAMKRLREARKETVASVSTRVKQQKKAIEAIKQQVAERPMTVPEIALATGIPSSEVLWFIATLKKYGIVVELDKEGSFFRYQMAETARG